VAAGVAAGARRRYDPAAAFARVCDGWLDDCAGVDLWAEVVRLEPAPGPSIADRLDDALSVVADIVDVKTPSTAGHSRAVAAVGGRAAELLRAGDGDAAVVRRAGLVHDLGRVTVSNAVWERPGALTGAD
jgi:HD-GYP domain-containing protein (c-di-GMP phosphodiesterase class II)